MTLPKKGSREIEIDGETYRWLVRKKAKSEQENYLGTVVEHAEEKGATLIISTKRRHPSEGEIYEDNAIVPADIFHWVKNALKLGWTPKQRGSQFEIQVDEDDKITVKK